MLAGRIPERGRIELVEAPEPELPPDSRGEIVFRPEIACLCGSDLPYFDGPHGDYPRDIGHSLHEMVGSVTATSGGRFRPGDRVLAVPVEQRGLFERFRLDEGRAVALDPRPPPEHALLAQPLGTVLFALRKLPGLVGCDAAVVGQGPIGQIFCAALRRLGAREIVAVDRRAARLEPSTALGATRTVCSADEDPEAAVRRATGDRGADLVVEAVGHEGQAEALHLAIRLARSGGRILSFGVPSPAPLEALPWRAAFFKNLSVTTSVNPDFELDFPLAMRWIAEGRVDLSRLITHRFPLREVQRAFETFRDRRDGAQKVLLEFPAACSGGALP